MPRIDRVNLETIDDDEVQAIAEQLRSYKGTIPDHYQLEGHIPALLKHVWYAQDGVYDGGPLSTELLYKIGIAVSMNNGCAYCTGAYCSLLTAKVESGETAVEQFQEALADGSLTDRESAIIEFALQANDTPHDITDDTITSLRQDYGLTDTALLQIVYQVNLVSGYNRLTTVFDAEYDHDYPESHAEKGL